MLNLHAFQKPRGHYFPGNTVVDVTYKAVEQRSKMHARVRRASYVNSSLINKPDAGATAINCVFV